MRYIILFVLLVINTTVFAQKNWELKKNIKDIKVYYRDSEGSYIKELKISTSVNASLSAVYALLNDFSEYTNWIYGCSHAEFLERVDETEMYYYAITDFPWPMSDRDYVVRSKMMQDPLTGVVSSVSKATASYRAKEDDMVRIQEMKITWEFEPDKDGNVQINYYLKSDPGGNIPAWAVNMALDRGPVQSMLNFKKLLQAPKYQDIEIPHINNFNTGRH